MLAGIVRFHQVKWLLCNTGASTPDTEQVVKRHLLISIIVIVLASFPASMVQDSNGRVHVQDIKIPTQNGQWVVADLYKPRSATSENPAPGVLTHKPEI